MECLLVRHGLATEREGWEGEDAERPLTDKGRGRTKQVAGGLATLNVTPSHVFTSPFLRAHETAEILRRLLASKLSLQICDELRPDSPPDKLFPLLATLPMESTVMLVGHEPQLSDLAGLMLFGKPAIGLGLKKAGAALIQFDQHLIPGRGRLDWWLGPSILRKLRSA